MQSITLGYKEILRVAKPDEMFWGLFTVLCFGTLIWCGGYALWLDSQWTTWQSNVAVSPLIRAIQRPETVSDENYQRWTSAIRTLIEKIDQETLSEPQKKEVFKGYALLHKQLIKPTVLQAEPPTILKKLFNETRESPKALVIQISKNERGEIVTSPFIRDWRFLVYTEEAQKVVAIWPLFPNSGETQQVYTALDKVGNPDNMQRSLLYNRAEDIFRAVKGNLEEVFFTPAPPFAQGAAFLQNLKVGGVIIALIALFWTWFSYLITATDAGIRPWKVKWTLLTSLMMILWSPPITVTLLTEGTIKSISLLGKVGWAIMTGDLRRLVNMFRKREVYGFERTVRDEALTFLLARYGEIEIALKELRLKELGAGSEQEHIRVKIETLVLEQMRIDTQIKAFQPPEAQTAVDKSLELDDASMRKRYEAMRKFDPSIPPLPLPPAENKQPALL
ncbi:MAG: hypothetical protein G01um101433_1059 [Parcubacteria group bacterium Gr01-1014_33]|nr:MAG: hypothetical protein G01um101433_1059 [Parcubacteria group bacterium Gr01-1014_33]